MATLYKTDMPAPVERMVCPIHHSESDWCAVEEDEDPNSDNIWCDVYRCPDGHKWVDIKHLLWQDDYGGGFFQYIDLDAVPAEQMRLL